MVKIEVCIATDDIAAMRRDVNAAHEGGAATIELCSRMDVGGMTPEPASIEAAKKAFPRPGAMVMVRPRPGGFEYSLEDLLTMQRQIHTAARSGADGVVLGVLTPDHAIAREPLLELVQLARSLGLRISMHRAFDDAREPVQALEAVIELGFERILTAGTPYQQDLPAVEGIPQLHQLIRQAAGRIEIVIGGGVNPENAGAILANAPQGRLALHAFSGVQVDGIVSAERVRKLIFASNEMMIP